jgi:MGT family glycosyltransferase
MATIIVYMLQEPGHLLPSYRVAEKLQDKGHKIIYIGSKSFRREIISYGFTFKEVPEAYIDTRVKKNNWTKIVPKVILQTIKDIKDRHLYNTVRCVTETIISYNPDLILLDELYTPYIISISRYNIPLLLISVYLSPEKDINIPPLSSTYIPKANFVSKIWTEWLWFKTVYQFRKKTYFGYYSQNKKLAHDYQFPLKKRINHNRLFVFGIKDIPTLILCPRIFDFPRQDKPHRFYLEDNIVLNRELIPFNWDKINLSKPIIYCSLGTQAQFHFSGCGKFYKKIIDIFREKPNYNLIVSTGKELDLCDITNLPSHIMVCQKVPQIEILKKATLFITHGGMGSFKEAVYFGVPMLVFPVNLTSDQNGNAARIFYHKIGLRGNIRKDSTNTIRRKINQILNTNLFQVNIKSMQKAFINCEQKSSYIEIIEHHLKKAKKTELVKTSIDEHNEIYSQ